MAGGAFDAGTPISANYNPLTSSLSTQQIQSTETDIQTMLNMAKEFFQQVVVDNLLQMLQDLTGIDFTAFEGLFNSQGATSGNLLIAVLGAFGVNIGDITQAANNALASVQKVIDDLVSWFGGIGTGNTLAYLGTLIQGFVADVRALLGGGKIGGTSSAPPPIAATVGTTTTAGAAQSLAQILGAITSDQNVPVSAFSGLSPGASPNVLYDPSFTGPAMVAQGINGYVDTQINGSGQWTFDAFQGNTHLGCLRTQRTGVITLFHVVGTYNGSDASFLPDATMKEYFLYQGNTLEYTWIYQFIDTQHIEVIMVPYGGYATPGMRTSIAQGVTNLTNLILSTPGPFILSGHSQGAMIISNVYDLIRYGKYDDGIRTYTDTSLMSRNDDLLAGVALGNPRRQQGWVAPPLRDPCTGTLSGSEGAGQCSGVNLPNLANCEDKWWEFTVAGDGASAVPTSNAVPLGYWMHELWNTVVQQNQTTSVQSFLTLPNVIEILSTLGAGGIAALTNAIAWYTDTAAGGATDPHDSYFYVQPGASQPLCETAAEYINSFAHLINTPVNGSRRQIAAGPLYPVTPGQVIVGGCSFNWINVAATGDQMIFGVNVYDQNNKLIAIVQDDLAMISNPPPSSNWQFQPVSAEFVMPPEAAFAIPLIDIEPETMQTGIVWVDDVVFETTNFIAGQLIDQTTLDQLTGEQVQGPQGIANVATAILNTFDGIATGTTLTDVSGASLAQMVQAVAQLAVNAATALSLGVSNGQILSNVSTQPMWGGQQPSGQVTIPLNSFATPGQALPTITLPVGQTIMGMITVNPAINAGFVEFMARGNGGSGVYLNAYSMNQATGTLTNVWSSADISSSIANGYYDWVPLYIPTADAIDCSLGEIIIWEIVAQGMQISVVGGLSTIPNKSYSLFANGGAGRLTSTTGGVSPTSLLTSQMAFGGAIPYVCMSVTDLPANYQAPDQMKYMGNGIYEYLVPTWVIQGDLLDLVGVGAGGTGTPVVGTTNGIAGVPGTFEEGTFEYGTTVPLNVGNLYAIVGAGPTGLGVGGQTIIGYGLMEPTYDATGAGAFGQGANEDIHWLHDIAGNAIVAFVSLDVNTNVNTLTVTCGGEAMDLLGQTTIFYSVESGSAFAPYYYYCSVVAYGLINPPTGEQTVNVSSIDTPYLVANSISYHNVSGFGPVFTNTGTGTTASLNAPSLPQQMVAAAFSNSAVGSFSAFSGDVRYTEPWQATNLAFVMGDAVGANTLEFSSTQPGSNFGGIGVVLQPSLSTPLLTCPGGASADAVGGTNIGYGPGTINYNDLLYIGGADASPGYPGDEPGGAGGGGTTTASYAEQGGVGADGGAWITTYQAGGTMTGTGAGIGLSGGNGGNQLAVAFEAEGTGTFNTGSAGYQWTHNTEGGQLCCVLIYGVVMWTSGTLDLTGNFGNLTVVLELGANEYYNSGGTGIYQFVWGLIGAPSGSQLAAINTSGTGTVVGIAGNSLTYQNVGNFGTWYTNTGDTTAPALSIPTTVGEMAVCGFAGDGYPFTAFTGTTRTNQSTVTTDAVPYVLGDQIGGSTANFGALTSAAAYWSAIGGVLEPAT